MHRRVIIINCAPGAKSVIYDCLVDRFSLLQSAVYSTDVTSVHFRGSLAVESSQNFTGPDFQVWKLGAENQSDMIRFAIAQRSLSWRVKSEDRRTDGRTQATVVLTRWLRTCSIFFRFRTFQQTTLTPIASPLTRCRRLQSCTTTWRHDLWCRRATTTSMTSSPLVDHVTRSTGAAGCRMVEPETVWRLLACLLMTPRGRVRPIFYSPSCFIIHSPAIEGDISNAAIRPSVRPSVCHMPQTRQRCISGLWWLTYLLFTYGFGFCDRLCACCANIELNCTLWTRPLLEVTVTQPCHCRRCFTTIR